MKCICQNIRITKKQIERILNGDEVEFELSGGSTCHVTLCLKGGKP